MNEAYDAGPSLHSVAVTAVDHLIETRHRGFRRTTAVPFHHRCGQPLNLDLGIQHQLCPPAGRCALPEARFSNAVPRCYYQ
jgi:hypothetical protein